MLTSETIGDIKLFPAAYPEKYGDSVGAALDLQTRDGSRTAPTFRASIGLTDSELLGEGRLEEKEARFMDGFGAEELSGLSVAEPAE